MFFECTVRGGAKLLFGKVVFGQNWGLQKMGGRHFWGGVGCGGGGCYCMMLLDALQGCSNKPYKNWLFLNTLLLDAKTEKHPKKSKKGNFLHPFLGGP